MNRHSISLRRTIVSQKLPADIVGHVADYIMRVEVNVLAIHVHC